MLFDLKILQLDDISGFPVQRLAEGHAEHAAVILSFERVQALREKEAPMGETGDFLSVRDEILAFGHTGPSSMVHQASSMPGSIRSACTPRAEEFRMNHGTAA